MKTAVGEYPDLPGSPDALAFPKAPIVHVVRARVGLGLVALAVPGGRLLGTYNANTDQTLLPGGRLYGYA